MITEDTTHDSGYEMRVNAAQDHLEDVQHRYAKGRASERDVRLAATELESARNSIRSE